MEKLVYLLNNRWLLAGMLVVGLSVDLVLIGFSVGLEKADWAAWIQAVGSVFAIIGAFAVSAFQSKNEIEKDRGLARAEVRRKLRGMAGVVQTAEFCCDAVVAPFVNERYDRVMLEMLYESSNFEDTLAALKAIPLHELGTQDAVVAIFYIKDNLIRLQRTVEEALQLPFELPGPPGGSTDESVLGKERELSAWVGAYQRGIKNSAAVFYEHAEL